MAFQMKMPKLTKARRSVIAWLLLATPLCVLVMHISGDLSTRALMEETIMAQLVANSTIGRQALISSCWVPPLPILLKLPFFAYLDPLLPHAASRLLPVLALSALWLLLNSHLRSFGLGRLRWLVASLPLLSPHMIAATIAGSNAPLTALFATATTAALLHWTTTRCLRHLGAFGFAAAALAGCAPTIVPWLLPVALLLVISECFRASCAAEARAALMLALLPLVYAWAVWASMSWVIMGNPLYFIANLPHLAFGLQDWHLIHGAFHLVDWFALILIAAAVGVLGIQRRWQAACIVLLTALLIPIGRALATSQLTEHDPIPILCLLPTAAILLPQLARERPRFALILPGALLALLLAADVYQFRITARTLRSRPDAASLSPEKRLLPQVADYVRARTQYAKVFVTGYQGLGLLHNNEDPLFVPSLDFNFNHARDSYYGQDLFILVHAPKGIAATDSIHWRFPEIYRLGSQSTLYAYEWGDWRLFEIIQAPIRRN
jgi:hypothetical protein